MSDNTPTDKPINFIRHQINNDLDSGLHSQNQMAIYILVMQNLFV
ncbi:hypothetical protein MNB_SUP05-9-428 [hydrothermal vent metagenome]|uniref:Uncharacterized protein n=1 Tax=hydrothermal vent metagenome TaxID=652676 RepID=A0A1W1DRB7_9ZZZZ